MGANGKPPRLGPPTVEEEPSSSCCGCFGQKSNNDGYQSFKDDVTPPHSGRSKPGAYLPGGGSFSSTSSGSNSARSKKMRRIAILGFRAVGKTVVSTVFVGEPFDSSYHPTIENTFHKIITFNGDEYSAEILDTAGQDEYSILPTQYSLGVHGYVLIYSVASKASFDKIKVINDKLLNFFGTTNVPRVLVGNKSDMKKERQVPTEEGSTLAEEWGCPFIECSAKSNENIAEVFNLVMAEIENAEKATGASSDDKKGICSVM
eukprot:GFYU01007538.1.p1 GENE.GFYU01007538.1~~GFYU01007538.1.p1  ORF type:complete len:261 (+),score=59.55 GFYU01007538.1:179-961(+)